MSVLPCVGGMGWHGALDAGGRDMRYGAAAWGWADGVGWLYWHFFVCMLLFLF